MSQGGKVNGTTVISRPTQEKVCERNCSYLSPPASAFLFFKLPRPTAHNQRGVEPPSLYNPTGRPGDARHTNLPDKKSGQRLADDPVLRSPSGVLVYRVSVFMFQGKDSKTGTATLREIKRSRKAGGFIGGICNNKQGVLDGKCKGCRQGSGKDRFRRWMDGYQALFPAETRLGIKRHH